ncbi:MAG: hypothetical protein K8S98_06155 [Planctomycetes bacterium]|nr:hypothetical protein [Planctomycetota bacterium]
MRAKTILCLAPFVLAACRSLTPAPREAPVGGVVAEPAVLYGRDGKAVDGNAQRGAVSEQDQTGGRLTLLELYQKSCEERDALLQELELVRADLEKTQNALLDAQARVSTLESSSTSETQTLDQLRAENLDLAGRLATAHIRRMEAEKALLELKIAALAEQKAKAATGDPESTETMTEPHK